MGRRKKKKNKFLMIVAILVIAAIVAVLAFNSMSKPVDKNDDNKLSVVIEEGSSTDDIANTLKENDLIKSPFVFKLKSKSSGYDDKYKPGVYSIAKSKSMEEIMEIVASGETDIARFTIPEGYDTEQTMDVLVKNDFVKEQDFKDQVKNGDFDYKFLQGAPNGENRLEGYLYPETYESYKNSNAHDVIDKMLTHFDSLYIDEYYKRAEELGMTVNEIVTLASLIERETKIPEERAKVASVIYNRLEKGMKLQIDATIQYALDEPKEHLLYSDLEVDSPYNTYKNEGLPPGPICSPRIECIEAALYPEKTDYIFYVATPKLDGTHNFSATDVEFEKNKAAYKDAINKRDQ